MRLINAEYALATSISGLIRTIEGEHWIRVKEVRDNLKNVPTFDIDNVIAEHENIGYEKGFRDGYAEAVDTKPVRHGHWIKKERAHAYSSDSGIYRYECSLCHCSDEHNEDREVPYCWQCGALMDEAEFALVRHGKWIKHGSYFTCSVCDEEQYGIDSGRYYCQNCGAKMDLNEEDEDESN